MEVRNIHKDASWYASYEDSAQGKALILCQQKKIQQLLAVLKLIEGEIELAEDPKEFSAETVLQSVKTIVENVGEVEHTIGYFKWEG